MDIRIICIGDELLSGDTLNAHLSFIGKELFDIGLSLHGEVCVPDDKDCIQQALTAAAAADVILLTGGLGPTCDDVTRQAVADFFRLPIIISPAVRQHLIQWLGPRMASTPPDYLDRQSQVIQSAEILPNAVGAAPGLLFRHGKTMYVLLPGPPNELQPMFHDAVLPKIREASHASQQTETLRVCGLSESQTEAIASSVLNAFHDLHVAICIKADCIMLRLTADSESILHQATAQLKTAFGKRLLPDCCTSTAQYLGMLLKDRHLTVATAESCTGGGIAAAMTAIPGSSDWMVGGVVTYANEWKQNVLGVQKQTLATHGAVSEQTVHQMLDGLHDRFGVPSGVAISGIAGPGGGTPAKPVGTVVIGAFAPSWRHVETFFFQGNREQIRRQGIQTAIRLLIEGLTGASMAPVPDHLHDFS